MVQAAAAEISADPVNLLTFGEPVTHLLDQVPEPDAIVSYDWAALQLAGAELQSWLSYQSELGGYSREQLTEIRSALSLLDKPES